MKKKLFIIGLTVLLIGGGSLFIFKPRVCTAWGCLFTGACYDNSICGSNCFCMKQGYNLTGVCVTRP